MRNRETTTCVLRAMIAGCLLLLAATADAALRPEEFAAGQTQALDAYQTLRQAIDAKGEIPLIVGLGGTFATESDLQGSAQVTQQRTAIAQRQAAVVAALSGHTVRNVKRFETIPYIALTVDADGLDALLLSKDVVAIHEDELAEPVLSESVPLIGATQAWSSGFTGAGVAIAILDTGVSSTHPMLDGGKVISEACYSTNGSQSISTCPGNASSVTGAGSARPCNSAYSGCDHGTHVAGIAAGKGGSNNGQTLNGVAPDAGVIAVQVFSYFNDFANCGSALRCVRTYSSDQILGLERVYALRSTYNIAAVNMSLGGGQFASACDSAPQRIIIDQLRGANIATVISSGNDHLDGAIGAPACVSSAITVGSTTKSDAVSAFSNHSSLVDVLAPGSDIVSSVPSGYATFNGTSMAAPHVAGCIALYRHRFAGSSVDSVEAALESTGRGVSRAGVTKPRINCGAAVLGGGGGGQPPGPAVPLLPSGPTTTRTPTYRWDAVAGSTWYYLWVDGPSGNRIQTWYTAADVGCGSGSGSCAVTPPTTLSNGNHVWWIQTWNSHGYGPWSAARTFSVTSGATPPNAAVPLSPTGTTSDSTPMYQWTAVASSTWYFLWVDGPSGNRIQTWYTAAEAGCSTGTGVCSISPSTILGNGPHRWWVQTWNDAGYGPWSAPADFFVTTGGGGGFCSVGQLEISNDTSAFLSFQLRCVLGSSVGSWTNFSLSARTRGCYFCSTADHMDIRYDASFVSGLQLRQYWLDFGERYYFTLNPNGTDIDFFIR